MGSGMEVSRRNFIDLFVRSVGRCTVQYMFRVDRRWMNVRYLLYCAVQGMFMQLSFTWYGIRFGVTISSGMDGWRCGGFTFYTACKHAHMERLGA